MAVNEPEVTALQRLGLTERESRIYITLVKTGSKKASDISFLAHIPRSKTYGAIRELERKGMIEVVPGKPKPDLYAARSPQTLSSYLDRLKAEVKESDDLIRKLTFSYEAATKVVKSDVQAREGWLLEGRKDVQNKLNVLVDNAKKSISLCTSSNGLIRAYKSSADNLDEARKRTVTVRLLSPVTNQNLSVAREIAEIVELKDPGNSHSSVSEFASIDSKELLIVESSPDDSSTDRGLDQAMLTNNRVLVVAFDQLFAYLWAALPKAQLDKKRSGGPQ